VKENLFSYGTLQKEKVQIELFGRILQGSADMLRGYKTTIIEIRDESFLSKGEEKFQQTLIATADKNDIIKGTVLEITEKELLLADKYEPDNYKRIKIILESGKEAWIYIASTGTNFRK
jgi:gamma-glutamylcyclotransferase (GGCT)/AIG2-like uncharacterized protein YtfP